jgi:hypothetical protein
VTAVGPALHGGGGGGKGSKEASKQKIIKWNGINLREETHEIL